MAERTEMKGAKAKKVETYRDKYFTTIVYEYRGSQYEVTYPNGWQVCCSPAWIQHRDEQEKIDEMLDHPKAEPMKNQKTIEEQMDEIWQMMGW